MNDVHYYLEGIQLRYNGPNDFVHVTGLVFPVGTGKWPLPNNEGTLNIDSNGIVNMQASGSTQIYKHPNVYLSETGDIIPLGTIGFQYVVQ